MLVHVPAAVYGIFRTILHAGIGLEVPVYVHSFRLLALVCRREPHSALAALIGLILVELLDEVWSRPKHSRQDLA